MSKGKRIILFLTSLILLSIIYLLIRTPLDQLADAPTVLIFSSLIMLSFVTLFLEHFFTTPTDVLASTIAILLLLAPLRTQLNKMGLWYDVFFLFNLILAITSLTALLLVNSGMPSTTIQNKISNHLKKFSIFLGNGQFLFFGLFIITLLSFVDSQSKEFLIIFAYAAIILLVDPKKYASGFFLKEIPIAMISVKYSESNQKIYF